MYHTVISISFSYYSVAMAIKGELHVTQDVEVIASWQVYSETSSTATYGMPELWTHHHHKISQCTDGCFHQNSWQEKLNSEIIHIVKLYEQQ